MSINIDTKALFNYSPVDVNGSFLSDQKVDDTESIRAAFTQALNQAQQANRVGTPSILTPDVPQVTVKPGDNMTSLVKSHLLSKGFVPNSSDLKKMVVDVARQNGISNPNLIFPGQRLQMASLEASLLEGSFQASNKTNQPVSSKDAPNVQLESSTPAKVSQKMSLGSDLGLSEGEQVLGGHESSSANARSVRDQLKGSELAQTALSAGAPSEQTTSPRLSNPIASSNLSSQQQFEQRSAITKMAMSVMSSAMNPSN